MKLLIAAFFALVPMAAQAQAPKVPMRIEISTAGDHLRAHFHTGRRVTMIPLEPVAADLQKAWQPIQQRRWHAEGTGWREIDGAVAREDGAPFQDAYLDLYPDDRRESWIKPGVFRVGETGFVLHMRYLESDFTRFDVEVTFRPRPNETIEYGDTIFTGPERLSLRDYTREVYIGPKSQVRLMDGVRIVAPQDTPPWMSARLAHTVSEVAALFQQKMGLRDPEPLTLMLGLLDDGQIPSHDGWIGKAEYGSVLTLRIFSPLYRIAWPGPQASLDEVAAHETFHLWDGIGFRAQGAGAVWLEEGAAVYASLRARALLGLTSESDERRELDRHLALCRDLIGAKGLGDLRGSESYPAAYSCGAVIHWIAELAEWQVSKGKRDFFALWRDLIGERQRGSAFTAEGYLAHLHADAPAATEAIALILEAPPADRWSELAKRLAVFGIRTGPGAPPLPDMQKALVQHLFTLDCSGLAQARIHFDGEEIRMDTTAQACPHLGDTPDIVAIEGYLPRSQADAAYASMMTKCAAGGVVDVALKSGVNFGLVCNKPLAPLPASRDGFGILR